MIISVIILVVFGFLFVFSLIVGIRTFYRRMRRIFWYVLKWLVTHDLFFPKTLQKEHEIKQKRLQEENRLNDLAVETINKVKTEEELQDTIVKFEESRHAIYSEWP